MSQASRDFVRVVLAIVEKDIRTELRTKEMVSSMFVFAALVLLVFNFTLVLDRQRALELGPGVLWVAFVFAGTLGLNRSFAAEAETRCIHGLMLAPADRSAIYLGKLVSNSVFMFATEIFILPLFMVLFNVSLWEVLSIGDMFRFVVVLLLGTVGYSAVGTSLSAVAANTSMREVLLPVLLFPAVVPLVIGAAESTRLLFNPEPLSSPGTWIRVLIVFAVVFFVVSWLTFEYVLEE
ncbi:MAG TPA: heme exporter protein CcmB [Vicinamibacteria bacterium]|nr:heme exporter protein CcmB [Vicinamibacteria bacterium]